MVVLGQNFLNLCKDFKALFADKSAQKCNFASKLVKVRRGTPALCRPQVFPSYDHPILWQALLDVSESEIKKGAFFSHLCHCFYLAEAIIFLFLQETGYI